MSSTARKTGSSNENLQSIKWGDRVEIEMDGLHEVRQGEQSSKPTGDAQIEGDGLEDTNPKPAEEETGNPKSNYSGKFKALQEESSEESGSSDDEDSSDEISEVKVADFGKIYWIPEDNAYAHSSGIRYEVSTKEYTNWVTDDPDDMRCLHYMPFQGVIKLIRTGKRGKINDQVLKDMDWDRARIYTEKSYGYREDLHKLFRDKIGSNNKKVDE